MEFQPDYLISWDFSDAEHPTISVSRLRAEHKSTTISVDPIDRFCSITGVCSLRQIVEEFERKEKEKK